LLTVIDLEKHIVVDGGRDQGTNVFVPLLRAFLTTPQKQLKDKFFSDLEAEKSGKNDAEAKDDDVKEGGTTGVPVVKPKAKPKLQLKKKKTDDDPFASDDEEEEKPEVKTSKPPSKGASKPPSKPSGKPPSKAGVSAKKLPSKAGTAAKRIREESESDEEVKQKKKKFEGGVSKR
jgi:hypothetical protein